MTARVRCDDDQFLRLVRAGLTNAEIAARIGVTTRTLDRWRAVRPHLNAAIIAARGEAARAALLPCGTCASYRRGCRCQACVSANSARAMAWVAAHRGQEPPSDAHGKASTYQAYGCRCRPCTTAHSAYCRPYGAAWLARQRGELPPLRPKQATAPRRRPPAPIGQQIEQAIARGLPTTRIMDVLGVTYQQVQDARTAIEQAAS